MCRRGFRGERPISRGPILLASQRDADEEQAAREKAADDRIAESAKRADAPFEQQKWSAARAAYDRLLVETEDWSQPAAHRALERDVWCSLKLREFDGAFRQVTAYLAKRAKPWIVRYSLGDLGKRAEWEAQIAQKEFFRRLFVQIGDNTPPAERETLRHELAEARVAIDSELAEFLDPGFQRPEWGSRTRYPNMSWWWRDGTKGRARI